MKNMPNTIQKWFTANRTVIIDTIITVVSTLAMIAVIIVATTGAVVIVAAAWLAADGNPKFEAKLFGIGITIIGGIAVLIVTFRTENRYRRRRAESSPPGEIEGRAVMQWWRDHEDEALAIVVEHEARHAIVADALGYTVTEITTRNSYGSGGHVLWEEPEGLTLTEQRWTQALIALAPMGVSQAVMQADDLKVLSLLTQIVMTDEQVPGVSVPLTVTDLLAEAIAVTRQLITELQPAIDHLKEVLTERRVLKATDIPDVLLASKRTLTLLNEGAK